MPRTNVKFQDFINDIITFNDVLNGEILVKGTCVDPDENIWEVENIFNKVSWKAPTVECINTTITREYQLLSDIKSFVVPQSRRFDSTKAYDSALFVIKMSSKKRYFSFQMYKLNA